MTMQGDSAAVVRAEGNITRDWAAHDVRLLLVVGYSSITHDGIDPASIFRDVETGPLATLEAQSREPQDGGADR